MGYKVNFQLTDSQRQVMQKATEFAAHKLMPGVHERDENEFFDRELYSLMAASGMSGICMPKEYGGAGNDYLSYILAIEAIAAVDAGMAIALASSISLCATAINEYGNERQKKQFLAPLAKGEKIGAFALTEPAAGTDVMSLEAGALEIDDYFVLNGTKKFITNAGVAEIYVLFARTGLASERQGISAFIVENEMKGLSIKEIHQKMGIRSAQVATIQMKDVVVPKENLLGEMGCGLAIAMNVLNVGRIGVAAQAVGIAEAAFSYARNYAKKRIQFGKPIRANQGISFMLAEMKVKINAAKLLTYKAAAMKDAHEMFAADAAIAKFYASEVAMSVATDSVQIFGGSGFMRNEPVERLMRDAKITQIYEGTNQAQKMVISNYLFKEDS